MALQLNVSNSLLQLADQLISNLKKPMPSVFHPHYIITQTQGMNNWLKIRIADRSGIAANVRFLKPNDIIREVYFLLGGVHQQVLSADSLQWFLFALLDDEVFKGRYPQIASYYSADDMKRIALAGKLADLFDQYQIYRPEMIKEWNAEENRRVENNWQKFLWIEAKVRMESQIPDKTRISQFIVDRLQEPFHQQRIRELLPRIDFFGISIITAYHLEVFHALAKHIDIAFHLLNPSPSIYWFDDKSEIQIARWRRKARKENQTVDLPNEGNSLLTNWGKVIQDTFGLFFSTEEFLNEYRDEGIEPEPDKLLGKIQYDIFHNLLPEERMPLSIDDLKDGSIKINACYTPVREVEVLYNYLVHLVNENPKEIKARDVVVMVSDIDAYAPYINAIFGSAPYKFPFNIADESIQNEDGILGALDAILQLNEDNFKAESVLQLLEWSYISRRFKITDKELIRKAIRAANIRFGMEGRLEDDTIYVSWENGLNRIMYGMCMLSEHEITMGEKSFYPIDIAEGEQAFELIRFTHFVKVLMQLIKAQAKERSLVEWGEYILQVVDQLLFQSEDEEDEDNHLVINYIDRINLVGENVKEKISFEVFRHNFIGNISGEKRTGNFALGGITFCSLIPMRSIPFKVVALLGLGFEQFPRKEVPSNLDLMQLDKRRGDRNTKENDKHLFLETVLSAQQHLFISYQGRSSKDNAHMPPSAVVDELVDYILSGVRIEGRMAEFYDFVIEHPLHNFSGQPQGFVNYLPVGNSVNMMKTQPDLKMDKKAIEELSIAEFLRFFRNPFEFYYNRVLNIFYREDEILLPEVEDFELDKLKEWKIKNEYLFLDRTELPVYIEKGKKTGALPLKNMSVALVDALTEGIDPVKELVAKCIEGLEARNIPVEVDIDGVHVSGVLNQVYGERMVAICFSKHFNKYVLEAYIRHLLAVASGEVIESAFVLAKDTSIYTIGKGAISQQEAIAKLSDLLCCYKEGCESPFVYYPGFEHDPVRLAKFDNAKFKKMIDDFFTNPAAPCNDRYLSNEFQNGFFDNEGVFEEYMRNSTRVISDAFRAFKL